MISFNFHLSYPLGCWKPTLLFELWAPLQCAHKHTPCLIVRITNYSSFLSYSDLLFFRSPSSPVRYIGKADSITISVWNHKKIHKKQGAGFLGCVRLLSNAINRLKDTGCKYLFCVCVCISAYSVSLNAHWKQVTGVWSLHAPSACLLWPLS